MSFGDILKQIFFEKPTNSFFGKAILKSLHSTFAHEIIASEC